jgi:hypothetical protein
MSFQPPFGSPRGAHPWGVFYLFGFDFFLPFFRAAAAAFLPAAVHHRRVHPTAPAIRFDATGAFLWPVYRDHIV